MADCSGIREWGSSWRRLESSADAGLNSLRRERPTPATPPRFQSRRYASGKVEGLVQFPGYLENMPELLAEADIFVLPSYREGLPRSLIEAGACGLPLIATDVPGCRDVITNGRDGILVPARDATALAGAISRLVADADLASRLGLAARERVLRSFNENIIIGDTLDVYDELMPGFTASGETR